MTVWECRHLKVAKETERNLNRDELARVPVHENEELADLFRRGDLVKTSELEAKLKAEEEAQGAFEAAAEDMKRDQQFQSPRPTTKDTAPQWHRERTPED